MKNPVTRIAAFEDCCRLAERLEGIEPPLLSALRGEQEMGRLGAVAAVEGSWVAAGLAGLRDGWGEPEAHPEPRIGLVVGNPSPAGRLALCLGALVNLACEAGIPSPAGVADAAEAYRYQDAHVLRRVYLEGHEEEFGRALLAGREDAPEEAAEDFARAMFYRALASSHTIMPDTISLHDWLGNLENGVAALSAGIHRSARALYAPDPALVERYDLESGFYRADDPAVKAARALQRGEAVSASEVRAALAPGANESAYGRAVEAGMEHLMRASAFWRGEICSFSAPEHPTPASDGVATG
jgi:hypothetical protein